MNVTSQPAPPRAIRMIFEYDGDEVRLVSQQTVDVAITGFDIARSEAPGYYVDTRDEKSRTLARVPIRHAFSTSMEVFPEKHDEPITRVEVEKPQGAFTVVVPAPAEAHHVAIVKVAPGKAEVSTPSSRATTLTEGNYQQTVVATFPLNPAATGGGQP